MLVQLLADAGDLTLADAFQAQGLHQVVHLPGADAVDVSLLDDGQQGPFGPPAWLQEAGEVAPLPQPRDSQRNGADPGVPVPEAVPVTVVGALGGTFIASGADLLRDFEFHQRFS